MTYLFSFFETLRILLFGVFLQRKIITILRKNHEFQASVTERCTTLNKSSGIFMLNTFKVPVKKIKL